MAAIPAQRFEECLTAWQLAHLSDDELRPRRSSEGLLRMLNYRLQQLGSSVEAVKSRVRGDNALGRQEFGESDFVHWN